jgi:hypothetical protein
MYPLPGFLLAFDFENSVSELGLGISIYTNNIQTTLAIFAGYFLVVIGFYAKSAQEFGRHIIIKACANNLIVFVYAIFLLLFSCLSIYIYGLQYGGFLNALASTALIRVRAVEGGSLAFFKHFALFSLLASYLLGSFLFSKKMKTARIYLYIIFICSVISSLIAVTLTGGRAYLINYLLVFALVYLLKSKRVSWVSITLFGGFAVCFLLYGRILFYSLTALPKGYEAVVNTFLGSFEHGSNNDLNFYQIMQNFHYPVHSLDVAFSKDYQLRWFVDLIYGFTSLIPERLLGITPPETIMYYNSEYIIGSNDFSIPTGFLAFGIYSMWWPGLIVVCLTYGWVGRYLQTILNKHMSDIFWMPFLYSLIAQIWMDFLASDPETFIQQYISLMTGIVLLFFIASKVSIVQHRQV